MLTATIVKDSAGSYHIRTSRRGPEKGGEVTVVHIMYQQVGEHDHIFEERCARYVRDELKP